MERHHHIRSHLYVRALYACAGLFGLLPMLACADGSHVAQNPKPGDIVVMRNVATRPADRPPTAPGMALMVSASPNPQLVNTMTGGSGTGEIADADIANLNAGPGAAGVSIQTNLQRPLGVALGTNGSGSAVSSNGISNTVSAPLSGGAIADGTRTIGEQVTSALTQMPVLGAGH